MSNRSLAGDPSLWSTGDLLCLSSYPLSFFSLLPNGRIRAILIENREQEVLMVLINKVTPWPRAREGLFPLAWVACLLYTPFIPLYTFNSVKPPHSKSRSQYMVLFDCFDDSEVLPKAIYTQQPKTAGTLSDYFCSLILFPCGFVHFSQVFF